MVNKMTHTFCAACGSTRMAVFGNAPVALHDGSLVHGLSGQRCEDCGEVWLDAASHARFAAAGNAAVLAQRQSQRDWLRQVRKKLGLSQHQAAQLTGGGHNAFGRYERGEARPLPAVIHLFKILDAHPELLDEVRDAEYA